jgi:PKD domain/Repeat of unknown function (DUF5648)/Carboxypeptidase regulatory-like domain
VLALTSVVVLGGVAPVAFAAEGGGTVVVTIHAPDGYIPPQGTANLGLANVAIELSAVGSYNTYLNAVTNESGRAELSGVTPGQWNLWVDGIAGSDLLGGWYVGVPLLDALGGEPGAISVADAAVELDVTLQVGASLDGSVVDADGAPVEGAAVSVGSGADISGSDGSFHVLGLRPDSYVVAIRAPEGSDAVGGYWAGDGTTVVVSSAQAQNVTVDSSWQSSPTHVAAVLGRGGSVSGTVRDAAGVPVAGAAVSVDSDPPRSSLTAPDGSYTVRGVAAGATFAVSVAPTTPFDLGGYRQPDGSVTQSQLGQLLLSVGVGQALTDIDITLGRGGRLDGAVVLGAGQSGRGQVSVYSSSGRSMYAAMGDDGKFSFPAAPTGLVTVSVYLNDHNLIVAPRQVSITAGVATWLDLEPVVPGSITGHLTIPAGSSASAVRITALRLDAGGSSGGYARSGWVDVTGRYVIGPLEPGTYQVTASHADLRTATVGGVVVAAGAATTLDLSLDAGGSVRVSVTAAGQPVEGALVTIMGAAYKYVTTDMTGLAVVAGLAPGTYALRVERAGLTSVVQQVVIPDSLDEQSIAVVLAAASAVTVHVTTRGVSASSTPVYLVNLDVRGTIAYSLTDAAGSATFASVASGRYVATASDPYNLWAGTLTSDQIVVTGGAPVDAALRLDRASAISGIVSTGPGAALERATVTVHRADAPPGLTDTRTLTSDVDGTFSTGPLADGTYYLEVSHPEALPYVFDGAADLASATPIVLEAGASDRVINPVLTPRTPVFSVVGSVADTHDEALAGVQIEVRGAAGTRRWVTTDAEGHYRVDRLDVAEAHTLIIASGDTSVWAASVTELPAESLPGSVLTVSARLAAGGAFVGSVLGEALVGDPVPLPGAQVWAYPYGDWRQPVRSAATAPDGTFTLTGLTPGIRYGITASKLGDATDYLESDATQVDALDGSSQLADLVLRLGGSITGTISYPGAASTQVQLYLDEKSPDPSGGQVFGQVFRWFTVPTSGGAYALRGLPPGTYTARFLSDRADLVGGYLGEQRSLSGARTLTIERGTALQGVDFAFESAAGVAGLVSAGGVPLTFVSVDATLDGEAVGATETGADGRYSLGHLPAGELELRFSRAGLLLGSTTVTTLAGETTAHDLAVPSTIVTSVIGGRVTLGGGAAHMGWVRLSGVDGNGSADAWASTTDGNYQIVNVAPGDYRLSVDATDQSPSGYLGRAGALVEDAADAAVVAIGPIDGQYRGQIDVEVPSSATISGSVIAGDPQASLAGVGVVLQRMVGGQSVPAAWTDLHADGSYSFTSLWAGDYDVTVGASSPVFVAATIPVRGVVAGALRAADLRLDRYGTARVHVRDVDGQPVASAIVRAQVVDATTCSAACVVDLRTDANGDAMSDALQPVPYRLSVTAGADSITTYLGDVVDVADAVPMMPALNTTHDIVMTSLRYGSARLGVSLADASEPGDVVTLTTTTTSGERAVQQVASDGVGLAIDWLLPGRYTVSVSGTRYATAFLRADGSTTEDPAQAEAVTVRGDGASLNLGTVTLRRHWVSTATTLDVPATTETGVAATAEITVTSDELLVGLSAQVVVDGDTVLPATLVDGHAKLALPADLEVGHHTVQARYAGGGNLRASASDAIGLDVTRATSFTTATTRGETGYGTSALLDVAVAALVPVAGTVAVLSGTDQIAAGQLVDGQVSVTLPADLPVGDHPLTVHYPGSASVDPSSTNVVARVVKLPATLTLTPSSASTTYGDAFRFDVAVVAGVEPTGTVSVSCDGVDLATVGLVGGLADLTVDTRSVGTGNHVLTVHYSGDDHVAVASASLPIVVLGVPTTTNLIAPSATVTFGSLTSVDVFVAAATGVPEGRVDVRDGTDLVASGPLIGGRSTIELPRSLAAGTHALRASYVPTGAHLSSESSSLALEVSRATSIVTVVPPARAVFGETVGVSVEVRTDSGYSPSGTVTASVDGTEVTSTALWSGRGMLWLPPDLTVGSHEIVVAYAGSPDVAAAITPSTPLVIVPGAARVVTTPSVSVVPTGRSFSVDVVAAAAGNQLTYSVSFGDGSPDVTGDYVTALSLSHTYASAGTFLVRAEVRAGADVAAAGVRIVAFVDGTLSAQAGDAVAAVVGADVTFDAARSQPTARIDSYTWDFGDGAVATGRVVAHAYAEPGQYVARLTVTSGSESSSADLPVAIAAAPVDQGVDMTVRTAAGLLRGAQVTFVQPDGARVSASTDSVGIGTLTGLVDGPASIYVWADGYIPQTVSVQVVDGRAAAEVTLLSGEVGATTLSQHRLTLSEIVAAGIDVADPENTQVYEAEIHLFFEPKAGEPARTEADQDVHVWWGWGAGEAWLFDWSCSTGCPGDGSGSGGGGQISATPSIEVVEGKPVVQWLVIPVRASFLKEMFEVQLVVQNLAEGYTFADGMAELHLPDGLSLATMVDAPQSLTVRTPDVPGGASSSTTWYVRGDAEGDYDLSATYSATVDPLGRSILLESRTERPLKVWAGSALLMTVTVDPDAERWGPYRVSVTFTNTTSGQDAATVNNLTYELLERAPDAPPEDAEYFFGPGINRKQTVAELASGKSVTSDFVVYPGIGNEEVTSLANILGRSFIARTGGTVDIPTRLVQHASSMERRPLAATVVKVADGPDELRLTWDRPSGDVQGYTVYTRDTLRSTERWRAVGDVTATGGATDSFGVAAGVTGLGTFFTVASHVKVDVPDDGTTDPVTTTAYVHAVIAGAPDYVSLGDGAASGEGVPNFERGTDVDRQIMATGSIADLAKYYLGNQLSDTMPAWVAALLPGDGEPDVGTCHRSLGSYGRLLADDPVVGIESPLYIGCSGALTRDLDDPAGGQIDNVSDFTKLITITSGRDDVGFSDLVDVCSDIDPRACATTSVNARLDGIGETVLQATFDQNVAIAQVFETYKEVKEITSSGASCVASKGAQWVKCLKALKQASDLYDMATADPLRHPSPSYAFSPELQKRLERVYRATAAAAPNARIMVTTYPALFNSEPFGSPGMDVMCNVNAVGKAYGYAQRIAVDDVIHHIDDAIRAAVSAVQADGTTISVVDVEKGVFDGAELCRDGVLNSDSAFHGAINPFLNWIGAMDATAFSFQLNAKGQRILEGAIARSIATSHQSAVVRLEASPARAVSINVGRPADRLVASLASGTAGTVLELVGPDGQRYDGSGDAAVLTGGSGGMTLSMGNPVPGTWVVEVSGGPRRAARVAAVAADADATVSDAASFVSISLDVLEGIERGPSATATVTRAGDTYTFDATSSTSPQGRAVSFEWLMSDGQVQTGAVVTRDFSDPVAATAVLRVVDAAGAEDVAEANYDMGPVLGLLPYTVPQIAGTAAVGATLTVSTGGWVPEPASATVQWLLDDEPLPGETGATYTAVRADANHRVSARVVVSAPGYRDTTLVTDGVVVAALPLLTEISVDPDLVVGSDQSAVVRVTSGGVEVTHGVVDLVDATTEAVLVTSELTAGGSATLGPIPLSAGAHTLVARYHDPDSALVSQSDPVEVRVARASSRVSVDAPPTPTPLGAPASVVLEVVAPRAVSGDVVAVTVDAQPPVERRLAASDLTSTGARLTVDLGTGLGLGEHTVTAGYAGNADEEPSEATVPARVIVVPATTIAVTAPDTLFGDSATVHVRLTVAGSALPSTATANLTSTAGAIGSQAVTLTDGAGTVGLPSGLLPGGYPLVVTFAGTRELAASTGTATLYVGARTPAMAMALEPATGPYGSPVGAQVTATSGVAGLLVDGTVTVLSTGDSAVLATGRMVAGTAHLVLAATAAGTRAVVASLVPDHAGLSRASSPPVTMTTAKAVPVFAIVAESPRVAYGQVVRGTVTAMMQGAPVAGRVEVSRGGETVEAAVVSGGWTFELPGTDVGTATVAARLVPTSADFAETSATADITTEPAETHVSVAITADASPNASGTALVAVTASRVRPSGDVRVLVDGAVAASGTLTNGQFTMSMPTGLAGGPHTVVARFLGGANFLASSSPAVTYSGLSIVPVFRFWSPGFNNAHFFTTNVDEAAHIRQFDSNWRDEGQAFSAYPADGSTCAAGTLPVHRFYSAQFQSHFFTVDEVEKEHIRLADTNWNYEGVAYCAVSRQEPGTTPLYRFWSPGFGKHFYTADAAEAHQLDVNDPNWDAEGIAYYVIP